MERMLMFVDADGNSLFNAAAEALPRKGDVVVYSMEARDREKWNDEAWDERQAITGKEWRVESVQHEFRRLRIDSPEVHVIFVHLTPKIEESN
jgi:hypothetical protein